MKEFEKWIKQQKYESPNYSLGAEDAWKAALEWVKSQSQVGKSLYMIECSEIDRELE